MTRFLFVLFVAMVVQGCGFSDESSTSSDQPKTPTASPATNEIELSLDKPFHGEDVSFRIGHGTGVSSDELFDGFGFILQNNSKTKIIRFTTFDTNAASLTDEHGNDYQFRQSDYHTPRRLVTVHPGEGTFFTFGFERTIPAATKFTLTMDASNFGYAGMIQVRFTRDEYEALANAARTKAKANTEAEINERVYVPRVPSSSHVEFPEPLDPEEK